MPVEDGGCLRSHHRSLAVDVDPACCQLLLSLLLGLMAVEARVFTTTGPS